MRLSWWGVGLVAGLLVTACSDEDDDLGPVYMGTMDAMVPMDAEAGAPSIDGGSEAGALTGG